MFHNNSNYAYDNLLHTNIAGIEMQTPVLAASGTFGFGEEFADFVDLARLGGVMVKGTTLLPRCGNDGVRIAETPEGMLNCIGLENPGVDVFLTEILPRIRNYGMNVIVNISGSSVDDYAHIAARLNGSDIAALEINISCPNVKEGGIVFGTDPHAAAAVVRAVCVQTNKPVIAKLSPNVTSITEMALAVENAGANIISLINTLVGMRFDLKTRKPILANGTGGMSGPAVFPVALKLIRQVAQTTDLPIIGMGGVDSAEAALEMYLAGASAIGVGTANFTNPYACPDIIENLPKVMDKYGISSLEDLRKEVKASLR